jgi:hypothetical protein
MMGAGFGELVLTEALNRNETQMEDPNYDEFEFLVLARPNGGYTAHSLGACIMTEADDLESLEKEIRDAVCCHFDEECRPVRIKLSFIEVVSEKILEP